MGGTNPVNCHVSPCASNPHRPPSPSPQRQVPVKGRMSYEAGVSLCPGETWGTQGQTLFPNLQSCVRPAGVVSPYRALDRNQGQKISPGYKNKSVHEGLGRIVTTKTRLLQFVMLPWGKGFTLASSLRPSSSNLPQQLPARSSSQEGPHGAQVFISLSFAHQVFPELIKFYLYYCAHPSHPTSTPLSLVPRSWESCCV